MRMDGLVGVEVSLLEVDNCELWWRGGGLCEMVGCGGV
ncbi:hypothetical protein Hamer_G007012 [Homarus americanus]|uniref:Uncharacterized protein n=1 Tax=Homarus americanus TaxID=6706 RepID=A0A8J5TIK0_HOMAM|nr:hypothetical protein Hamer_G007012 [Homarus americanus]